jgi:hypothetical protein
VTTVTNPYLPEVHERVQRDPIEVELEQRKNAELLARDMAKVLQEVTIVFDGARLEGLRRDDPKVPHYWTPEDWRRFFAKAPPPAKAGWGQADSIRVLELERTIEELRKRLADTEKLLTQPAPAELAKPAYRRMSICGSRPASRMALIRATFSDSLGSSRWAKMQFPVPFPM